MSSRPSSHSSSSEDEFEKLTSSINYEEIKELETFVYTDHKSQNLVDDIDPDNNFFANTNNTAVITQTRNLIGWLTQNIKYQ